MPLYEIVFARSTRKDLQPIPYQIAECILEKVELLAVNPRPSGCKKLHGYPNLWRIRVGEYRIIYRIDDEKQIIDVSFIRHRSDAYR